MLQVDKPVQVFIQLRRPSDGEMSDPLPFQLTPLDSGRPAFWSLRRYKADYRSFSSILSADTKRLAKIANAPFLPEESVVVSQSPQDTNNNTKPIEDNYSVTKKCIEHSEVFCPQLPSETQMEVQEQTVLKDDADVTNENYTVDLNLDNNKKIDEVTNIVNDAVERSFDDLIDEVDQFDDMMNTSLEDVDIASGNDGIYSSFQLAMRNPFEFTEYGTSGYEDVVPPRPSAAKPVIRPDQVEALNEPICSNEVLPPLPPKRIRKSPPNKNLPPVPEAKKLNIFQKLFSSKRKDKSRKNSVSSISSRKSLSEEKPMVEDSTAVENLESDDVILTEAEHYALYTAFAPHATASEFDETSFYYSAVEGQTQIVK